jgi:hypothetical protein
VVMVVGHPRSVAGPGGVGGMAFVVGGPAAQLFPAEAS